MSRPEFSEDIFFVHPHGLYLEGAQTALPGLKFLVDRPELNSTIQLLQDPEVQAQLPSGSKLLLFKPAPKIEFLAKEHGWELVSVSSELNRRFESKLSIASEFAEAGVPTLPFEIVVPEEVSWEHLYKHHGDRLVVQGDRGHAGSSSALIMGREDWETYKKTWGKHRVKVSPYFEGETWTLNACVTHHGTLVSRPFLQLQGMGVCGKGNPLSTCGNWHKPVDEDLAAHIMASAEQFGDHLFASGYRGWFGLDAQVLRRELLGFIECNPRLTASTGIFTQMQVEAGQTPFLTLHILELLGQDYKLDLLEEQRKLNEGFQEYHVVLRNTSSKEVLCPSFSKQTGAHRMVARAEGTPIPPGEPYAMMVGKEPFDSGVLTGLRLQA